MSPSLTKLAPAIALLAGSLALGGCATKGYVNEQIATVNTRIDGLDTRLQQTTAEAQAASGQSANNAQRIDQLNGRVDGLEQRLAEERLAERRRARN